MDSIGAGMEERLTLLRSENDPASKREMFAEIILDLSPGKHEVAVELVIEDLNSENPGNLVAEYLEMSSFMSPALQLPGIVRILEEPALPLLQKTAMEHQLRQDLEVPGDQKVVDWRPLVENHLVNDPTLLAE